jgi:membrane-bound lytic murein transglycosylase D
MRRFSTVLLTAAILLAGSSVGAGEPLPLPAGLEPNVDFWTRIYTEVSASGGLIHDARHLDVVYEIVRFPSGLSRRARERHVERIKRKYADSLKRLARGRRTGLQEEEARALDRWPAGVTNKTLKAAAGNVRFQRGQADRFREGLVRAGAWRDYIEQVFDANGLPPELAALPHVESSFNAAAYSRVGAAGLWQFTRSTGRLFMRVDHVVDERLDARRSTLAAAKLLRSNYETLGTDLAEISRRYDGRTFGFASRNFYAEFLAALEIDRNAERYFGIVHPQRPQSFEVVVLDHFYALDTLERTFGADPETLEMLNPALRPSVWNGSKYVPKGFALALPPKTLSQSAAEALASIPAAERKAEQQRDRFYKVHRGDTLSRIAQRYRVRERELVAVNNLRSRHRIRVGQVLVLPGNASGGSAAVARRSPPADGVYRVRRGDTLSIIAQRFGSSEQALAAENDLRDRHRITVGQRLRIPGAETLVVAAASLSPPEPEEPSASFALARETDVKSPALIATAAVTPAAFPIPTNFPSDLPAPDPSDYAVGPGDHVTVQAAETLGHYAEWLEVPTSRLRRLNRMSYDAPVVIGRKAKLDFNRVTPETFERRRLAYHHSLQEEYFTAFEVIGTRSHTLRSGDSLWYLAERKYEVPVWLIRQFNPDVDLGALPAGTRLVIPEISPRSG